MDITRNDNYSFRSGPCGLGGLNWLLACLMFISQMAPASQHNIRFHKYSLEHGLSQEAVFAILQDRRGFMWFATQEGLNRFDGYTFRVFYHDPDGTNSLSHDAVYTMIEDHQGMLWLGTDGGGLDRFDPVMETFTHFRKDSHQLSSDRINIVFEDRDNVLWVGTDGGGLNRFSKTGQNFQSFHHDNTDAKSLNHDNIRAIHQDQQGRLWIGTDAGVNLFDPKTDSFINFKNNGDAPASLTEDSIRTIFSDQQGRLWIGSYQSGLIRIDSDGEFFQYRHEAERNNSLCHNSVLDIFQDNSGLIWVATDDGLCQWQQASDSFIRFRHDPQDLYSIGDNRTLSLYQDRGGVLWLGTFGGLNKWTASDFAHYHHDAADPTSLSSNIITAFAESRNGDIWVGSYDGLNRFDRQTKQFTRLRSDPVMYSSLSDNRIMSLYASSDDTLWIGTRGNGLDHYDSATGQFTHYRHSVDDPDSLSANGVTDILEDKQGVLWIATYGGGLNRFDRQQGVFTHFRHDPSNPNSLSTDRILTIYQSRNGVLWIGSEGGGLNRFEPLTGRFSHFRHQSDNPDSLSSDVPWSILEDPAGDLWIGTWGGGLNRWSLADRQAGIARFKHYGKKQGLLSTVIYDIVADPQGFLWLSTNKGLTRFDPKTERVKQYDVSHGLQDNEFNHNAAYISVDGQIFFGGSNGFNTFYADQIGTNTHQPAVVLTGIQKLNQRTGAGDIVLALSDIEFSYKDYVVAFEFAGLDYAAPDKNRYKYKLEGFDQEWIEIGATRRTTFTNLPAGDFIFRVKASNNDGIWSEQGLALNVRVTPPPWKTWWAYSLYALLILGSLLIYFRAHNRKLREKAQYSRHLENQVKLRTAELTVANEALEVAKEAAEVSDRSKGTFIATMSHELRTPMTSIIGFAESILEDRVNRDEGDRRISKIIRNANHLLQLMNNVLDISKIEVNRLEIEQIPLQPARLLQELEDLIGQRAREKQLTLDIHYQFPIPAEIRGDPTRLKQILLNLCSNAIKFTTQGGIRIQIHADRLSNKLHFAVIDTGIGIPADKLETVFEAFSQADSSTTRKFGGTGLGLSISKQLSEAMGGEMSLLSDEGKGSQFTFCVDMGKPAPAEWIHDLKEISRLRQQGPDEFMVPTLEGHILLAEDWPDNQELIRMYVERTGAKVTLVENGQQAVETALVGEFDMILMDVQMPELDGMEATQILRAAGFSKPIIALTANVSRSDVDQYLASGFDDHLAKPIERTSFYRTLAAILPSANESRPPPAEQDDKYQGLVDDFLARLPEIMLEIQQAAERQDWQELRRPLHNLKGLGGSFGFPVLSQLAKLVGEALAAAHYRDALTKLAELQQIASGISQASEVKPQQEKLSSNRI